MLVDNPRVPIQKINDPLLDKHNVKLFIKRDDLLDPIISGNKFRKLKYNLQEAKANNLDTLLTIGGAYSNHIHAVSYAGHKFGFKTIGVIRGEETLPLNPTLSEAKSFGMKFIYVSREDYRNKAKSYFIEKLRSGFPDFYLVPEGGSNSLAVKGCTEILDNTELDFDYVCCASGTGGTISGIICYLDGEKKVLGFPALKNAAFLKNDISRLIYDYNTIQYENWDLNLDYHFGGYAKFSVELIEFINRFRKNHGIQLDPIYTGKMLFGIYDLVQNGYFEQGSTILSIHTGGLQGIKGFNQRFGNIINQ